METRRNNFVQGRSQNTDGGVLGVRREAFWRERRGKLLMSVSIVTFPPMVQTLPEYFQSE